MKYCYLFIFMMFLISNAYADVYKIGDRVSFTYHGEKVIGVLIKVKKNKIRLKTKDVIMGYRRNEMSLRARAKFYTDDEKKYNKLLKAKKQKIELVAQKQAELLKKSPYKYLGKPITAERFAELYEYFNDKLYTDSKRSLTCPIVNVSKIKHLPWEPNVGDSGKISGKILQTIGKGKILLSITVRTGYYNSRGYGSSTSKNYIYCLDNVDQDNLITGRSISCIAAMTGTYRYITVIGGTRTVPLLEVLHPMTKKEFNSYLATGKQLYYFKKVPAPTRDCSNCKGSGKVLKGKGSLTYITCPYCNGNKKITIGKVTYDEIALKK